MCSGYTKLQTLIFSKFDFELESEQVECLSNVTQKVMAKHAVQ